MRFCSCMENSEVRNTKGEGSKKGEYIGNRKERQILAVLPLLTFVGCAKGEVGYRCGMPEVEVHYANP